MVACDHGEGCGLARCMVLSLCAEQVTGFAGSPPSEDWPPSWQWLHDFARLATGFKNYAPVDTRSPAAMLSQIAGQIADRWLAWFRSNVTPTRGRPGHLLDPFADVRERRRMSTSLCPQCNGEGFYFRVVAPSINLWALPDRYLLPTETLSKRVKIACPPLVDEWGPLLVARDWLLEQGLEPDMWREVHAFRPPAPAYDRVRPG